jgi:VIT1/CCC1 family predicted Fe2+/Mn2+ transporter
MTDSHHDHDHDVHHRNISTGAARAAVFGANDGLVSNVSLILGVAGANSAQGLVRVAGIAGLIAGAVSMAAGEYISMRAQAELLERELEMERREIGRNPEKETAELIAIYKSRGVSEVAAEVMARDVMTDPERALEVHAREELGIDPRQLGSPWQSATWSFVAFAIGAMLPLIPWFFTGGTAAIVASIVLAVFGAVLIGAALARFTGRPWPWAVGRQVLIVVGAAAVTFAIGSAVGVDV